MDLPVSIVALLRDARSSIPFDVPVIDRIDAVLAAVDADKRTVKQRVIDMAPDFVAGRTTMAQIARDLNVRPGTVWRHFKVLGVLGRQRRMPPTAELILMLRDGDKPVDICRTYGTTISNVYSTLRRDGFRLRRGGVVHDITVLRGSEADGHRERLARGAVGRGGSTAMIIDDSYAPIGTAPRNGTYIVVAHEEVGSFVMHWEDDATNDLFAPGEVGMWVEFGGFMTWKTSNDEGPSHWKPLNDRSVN